MRWLFEKKPWSPMEVTPEGAFVSGRAIPIYQQKTHGPKIDSQKRAVKTLQRLIKADFPESVLEVDDDGNLTKK